MSSFTLDGLVDAIRTKASSYAALSIIDIQDMYDIRAHIEGIATKRACENITEEKLQKLHEIIRKEEEYTEQKDYQSFQSADYDFHDLIVNFQQQQDF